MYDFSFGLSVGQESEKEKEMGNLARWQRAGGNNDFLKI